MHTKNRNRKKKKRQKTVGASSTALARKGEGNRIDIYIYARLDKSSLSNFEANILFLLQTEMLMKLLVVRARWAVHAHLLRCVRARAERDEQPRCKKRATSVSSGE